MDNCKTKQIVTPKLYDVQTTILKVIAHCSNMKVEAKLKLHVIIQMEKIEDFFTITVHAFQTQKF